MKTEYKKTVAFRLKPDLAAKLKAESLKTHRTMTVIVEMALAKAFAVKG